MYTLNVVKFARVGIEPMIVMFFIYSLSHSSSEPEREKSQQNLPFNKDYFWSNFQAFELIETSSSTRN